MEALAAISFTGNILQFVDVTGRLISSTRQISQQGGNAEHFELESFAREVQELANAVSPEQIPAAGRDGRVDTDPALIAISDSCTAVTNELLAVLDSLRLQEGNRTWESFNKALQTIWKADEIEHLQRRVERIGQTLASYLQRTISRKLNDLAAENRRLEAARTEEITDLKNQLNLGLEDLKSVLGQQEGSWDAPFSVLIGVAEQEARYSVEQAILAKFRFDTMDHRYDGISPAHARTFAWVYGSQEAEVTATTSSPFGQWLSSTDEDLFWISGKPGSGKSTLMKFLCNNPMTKEGLDRWAKDQRLITAEFFFWNAAKKSLQKSQQGLLRSILYQVLRQSPEMIEQLYPGVGQKTFQIPSPPTTVPSLLALLRMAFELAAAESSNTCFFFLIDGLDEYDGQPSDIIGLVNILKSMPNVKLCVSSRPWNEFEQSFGRSSSCKLYMQDLTRNDIRNYVTDTFGADENYQALVQEEEEQGTSLVNEIIESAQGVFLWVILVVRSFQDGLTNGDRIVDLQARLRQLPKDLNQYFERILLSDVDEFYRARSARMFDASIQAEDQLPLMAYWYMEQDADYAFNLTPGPLRMQQTSKRLRDTRKRLNACCKGLLEAHVVSSEARDIDMLPSSIYFAMKVDFLHRTVKDFLALPDTQKFLALWGKEQDWGTDAAICCALLAQFKTVPQERDYFCASGGVPGLILLFFQQCRAFSIRQDCDFKLLETLLDHLDKTLRIHCRAIGKKDLYGPILGLTITPLEGLPDGFGREGQILNFLDICAIFGFSRYIDTKLGQMNDDNEAAQRFPSLLRLALKNTDHAMVQMILQRGADPNQAALLGLPSNWELFLVNMRGPSGLSGVPKRSKTSEDAVYRCVRDMLDHGADTAVTCRVGGRTMNLHDLLCSAMPSEYFALVQHFFSGHGSGQARYPRPASLSGATKGGKQVGESTRIGDQEPVKAGAQGPAQVGSQDSVQGGRLSATKKNTSTRARLSDWVRGLL